MRSIRITLTICLCFLSNFVRAEVDANASFDPSLLAGQNVRIVQAGLVLTGDYNGIIDGQWGARSNNALLTYVRKLDATAYAPLNWHLGLIYLGHGGTHFESSFITPEVP